MIQTGEYTCLEILAEGQRKKRRICDFENAQRERVQI